MFFRRLREGSFTVVATALLVVGAMVATVYFFRPPEEVERREPPLEQVQAPPELMKSREPFLEGIEAIQRGDGPRAVDLLRSFSFGSREVEEYRLFYLATAHQLNGDTAAARTALARLWSRDPKFVYRQDAAFTLGSAYAAGGNWRQAAEVYGTLAARTEQAEVGATARGEYIAAKFYAGDPGAILLAARNTLIESPGSAKAKPARELFRSLASLSEEEPVPLSPAERLDRAEGLIAAGKTADAAEELEKIAAGPLPASLRDRAAFGRGTAYQQMRDYEKSNQMFEALASRQYRFAIPALFQSSANYRKLSAAVNPERFRNVKQRVRSGTRRVKRKGKTVRVPAYKTVTRKVKYIDAKAKAKKDELDRLESERLKDVLTLPVPDEIRKQALTRLIEKAVARNQDEFLREVVPQLVKLVPDTDLAIQRFWDRGWSAFVRGDLTTAAQEMSFIQSTYRLPNARRQARYWYARTLERSGEKVRAKEIYQDLADVPYEDLYAKFAVSRGAKSPIRRPHPLASTPDDWGEVAETVLPADLRLAYQLTALGAVRDARNEVQVKASEANRRYADMILGELYYSTGSIVLAHRFLRRAFPEIHSVEQDKVPVHFVKMYYPIRWDDVIREKAEKRGVDPYLVMALIHQESGFDPDARSSVGARGLMQLMPATGKELARKLHGRFSEARLDDPVVSIDLGTYYIGQVLDLFGGNVELAVAGYNGGPYRIKAWRARSRGVPLDQFLEGLALSETRNYVKRVTILRSSYRLYDPH